MPASPPSGSRLTLQGCLHGARLAAPLSPGIVVYALAFGAASSHRGLSLGESVAMSGIVYAGAAQMVSLELWRDVWTPGTLLAVALVTVTVNARFVLMGAALQPWFASGRRLPTAVQLFFLVDANFLIGSRYHEEGGRDIGVMLGSGLLMWVLWVSATVPGYLAGALVAEPRRYALDLVMPIFFGALAVPLWRGMAVSARPWLAAGMVALLVNWFVPGYLFIVAGALAGAAVGALSRDA